jgi:hypothetical protein
MRFSAFNIHGVLTGLRETGGESDPHRKKDTEKKEGWKKKNNSRQGKPTYILPGFLFGKGVGCLVHRILQKGVFCI